MKQITTTQINNEFNIDEFSNASGNGIFDVMVGEFKKHLHAEYQAQRIRGTDYANAFIQGLTHVLEVSQRYALEKPKLALELEILEAQRDNIKQEIDIKNQKLPLELQTLEAGVLKIATDTAVSTKQGGLIDAQMIETKERSAQIRDETMLKLPAEVEAIKTNTQLAFAELDLKKEQLPILKEELKLKKVSTDIAYKELTLKEKQIPIIEEELNLKRSSVNLSSKELNIKEQQLKQAEYELEHKTPAEVRMIQCQANLYCQKVTTENAQTQSNIAQEGSVIWHQNKLVEEQAKTYLRDAIQKSAKLLIDTWSVRYSTDPASADAFSTHLLNDNTIAKMVTKLSEDIGVRI